MNKILKNMLRIFIISFMIICILFFTITSEGEVSDEQKVNISIIPKTKVDIVLSKARTKVDVNKFETDIMNKLEEYGIDSEDIKISSFNAQKVNLETAFSWQQDISTSIGRLTLNNSGQSVVMVGNKTTAGKNAIWIEPDGNQEQTFNFNYSITFGDSFSAAGMLLRLKETDKSSHTLSGYMLSFNKTGKSYYTTSGTNAAIWQFVYDGVNTTVMQKTLVKPLSIDASGTLTVTATDSMIKISGGGLTGEETCEIDSEYTTGNGFGFFSEHYSHDCDQIGSFNLTNINLTTISTKSFKEVLQLPDWREYSEKFLVNIDDYENEELNDKIAYSELLSKLMNENMHFISWGNSKNETQFQDLIKSNNEKGIYCENSDYENCVEQTALYIIEVINKIRETNSQYVIVNNPISINVTPSGIMSNTIDSDWPYGKWKVVHDYTYYEQNMGQFAESGKLIDNLITTFNKTGKYQIYYKNSQVYPSEIYVHRKPIAKIQLTREENNITLESASYDLDEISKNNKGISTEEWKWKTSDETTWTEGKLETIDPDEYYIVSLRVKDNQETWSDITTRYVTLDENAAPIAQFQIDKNEITNYETLEIKDESYDPAGGTITKYFWEVYKNDELIYSGETPKTTYPDNEIGTYTIYLTVTNDREKTSDKFGRKFTIIKDESAPEVIVTPIESDWVKSQDVHLEFYDEGSSQLKYYKYEITDNQGESTTWSDEIEKTEDNIEIAQEGEKYLHIVAEDNEGNISKERITGIYKIDNSAPELTVSGDFVSKQIEKLTININAEDLLSGVKTIKLNGKIIQNGEQTLTKNGTYIIESEDIVGNKSSKEIVVNNIYRKCDKDLGHPDYSVDYDSCPICDSYSEVEILKTETVYDGTEKSVEYKKPEDLEIIEYYNSETKKYKDVGEYDFELKVMYEGEEYNTGITGILKILPKEITIEGIEAEERVYDKTNIVKIIGGNLVGVVEGDEVTAVIPEKGITESEVVGEWKTQIDKITLTGKESANYTLIQPEYGSILAKINKAEANLEIECPDKTYDKEVPRPQVNNSENTSEVQYRYYIHGEDEEIEVPITVGEYDVQAYQETDENYLPAISNKITFKIEPKEITIEGIQVKDKEYDGTKKVRITGGKLKGIIGNDEVYAIIPEEANAISENVGEWKVEIPTIELEGKDSENYKLIQPENDNLLVNIVLPKVTGPIPQTGSIGTNLIIIGISAIIATGIISYIKFKKI